jgi:hypothetical protein
MGVTLATLGSVLPPVSAFGLWPPRPYAAVAAGPAGTALRRGLRSPLTLGGGTPPINEQQQHKSGLVCLCFSSPSVVREGGFLETLPSANAETRNLAIFPLPNPKINNPLHQRDNHKQGRLFATYTLENHESAVIFASPTWKVIRKSFSSHSPICRTLQVSFLSGFQNGERQKSRFFVILHLEKSIFPVVFGLTDLGNGKNVPQTRFTNLWSSTQRPF